MPALLATLIFMCPQVNGHPLMGNVRIVDAAFADVRLQAVDRFPDYKIRFTQFPPARCGELRVVRSGGDFTIAFVENFAHARVRITRYGW